MPQTYEHTFNVTGRPVAYFDAGYSQGMDARAEMSKRSIPQVDPDDDQVVYLDLLNQDLGVHNLEVLVENGSRYWDLAKLRGFSGLLITPQYPFAINAALEQASGGDRWLDHPHVVRCVFHLLEDGS
jgi:hypothetical protein